MLSKKKTFFMKSSKDRFAETELNEVFYWILYTVYFSVPLTSAHKIEFIDQICKFLSNI